MTRLFTILTVIACAVSAHADTVILKGGQEAIRGVTVVSENAKEVAYTQGTAKRRKTVPTADVLAIVYDSQPRDYRLGVEFFNQGDFVNAVTRLDDAVKSGSSIPWLKEYASVYLGRAHVASGNFDKAIRAFDAALQAKPDSRWLLTASAGLARSHAALGATAAAESALNNLKGKVKAAGGAIDPSWELEADLILAEVYITGQNYDKASEACKRVVSAALLSKDETVKTTMEVRAKRLEAEAWLAAKNIARVKLVEQDLRSKASGNPMAHAAARSLGAAMTLLEGESEDDFVKAAYELSRVHVENHDVVSEMSRTCYLLGLVHLRLAGTLDGAKELAKGYFEETRRRFPESREALLARDQLKQM